MPAIVTAKKPKPLDELIRECRRQTAGTAPADAKGRDDPAPPARSAIITTSRKPGRFGDVPEMTEEEHRRRGDAADALWRELVRRATGS